MSFDFGEGGVNDLFNDNIDADALPSDGEDGDGNKQIFGQEDDGDEENQLKAGGGVKVEPKKRVARNIRPRLTVDVLRGVRGIQTIEEYYKNIEFKGKGYEREDLDEVLRRLRHWAHRMYPAYTFDDVLTNIERLGKKKPLQVHMSRYRLGLLESQQMLEVGAELLVADEEQNEPATDEPFDEFDALLGEQIAQSRLTPRTPHSQKSSENASFASVLATPTFGHNVFVSTPHSNFKRADSPLAQRLDDSLDYARPLPPSVPASPAPSRLNSEQMARIAENRRLAQERLRAKQQPQSKIFS